MVTLHDLAKRTKKSSPNRYAVLPERDSIGNCQKREDSLFALLSDGGWHTRDQLMEGMGLTRAQIPQFNKALYFIRRRPNTVVEYLRSDFALYRMKVADEDTNVNG